MGLIVQFVPTYTFPEKEYESLHIPGKNGDLILDKGSYQNVEKTYSLAKVFRPGQTFIASAQRIVSWLHSANGYARLEDSYEPEYYRLAVFKSDGELYNYFDQATTLEIQFECKPQRWLKTGEKYVEIANNDTIYNPTSFESLPEITFTTVAGEDTIITINDVTITLQAFSVATDITIDCEMMECFSDSTLYNSKLTLTSGVFPSLQSGTNVVSFSGATNFKIQPRWWTL